MVLTSGEKGRIAVSDPEKGILGCRDCDPSEEEWMKNERQRELQQASSILGIEHIEFLRFPDKGINQQAIPNIQERIQSFDPHIILSFNEAGTLDPTRSDHSWSSIATYWALISLLSSCPEQLAFMRYITYTLPCAHLVFDRYAELSTPQNQLITIDISGTLEQKNEAITAHHTQRHLVEYFRRIGILDLSNEYFHERIFAGISSKGTGDIFFGIGSNNPDKSYALGSFPEASEHYLSNNPYFYKLLIERFISQSSQHPEKFEPVLIHEW